MINRDIKSILWGHNLSDLFWCRRTGNHNHFAANYFMMPCFFFIKKGFLVFRLCFFWTLGGRSLFCLKKKSVAPMSMWILDPWSRDRVKPLVSFLVSLSGFKCVLYFPRIFLVLGAWVISCPNLCAKKIYLVSWNLMQFSPKSKIKTLFWRGIVCEEIIWLLAQQHLFYKVELQPNQYLALKKVSDQANIYKIGSTTFPRCSL